MVMLAGSRNTHPSCACRHGLNHVTTPPLCRRSALSQAALSFAWIASASRPSHFTITHSGSRAGNDALKLPPGDSAHGQAEFVTVSHQSCIPRTASAVLAAGPLPARPSPSQAPLHGKPSPRASATSTGARCLSGRHAFSWRRRRPRAANRHLETRTPLGSRLSLYPTLVTCAVPGIQCCFTLGKAIV